MEIHKMQKKQPDQMMHMIIKEIDKKIWRKVLFWIIQSIEKSKHDLKQSII